MPKQARLEAETWRESPTFDEDVPDIIYMGTYKRPGHYAFFPGMVKANDRKYDVMDSRNYPGTYKVPSTVSYERDKVYYLPEGKARVQHTSNGWTWLSWNDYSVDDRSGSHCVFLMRGVFDFDGALANAKANFAPLFEDFPYEVTEWEEVDAS